MPINPNIALQVQAPRFNAPDPEAEYSKALQLKGMLMQQQQAEQAQADERAQRQAFAASGGDETAYLKALMQGGNVKAYQAAQKAIQDREKAKADMEFTRARTTEAGAKAGKALTENDVVRLTQHNNLLAGVQTPEQAQGWIQAGLQSGAIKPEAAPLLAQTFANAQTPDAFQSAIQKLSLGMKDYIEKNKPTYQTRNTGGTTDTISMPGLGGPASVINSVRNTQSPDNAASNARMAADAAASRAQAERHFSVNKDLQREKLDWEKSKGPGAPKPLPASTAKLQNEELNIIGTFAGVDSDLAGIEKQIGEGKLNLGPVRNIIGTGRNFVGASTEESRNLASFKSKLENMRNAVLLLNKGVQTEGDAQRAMNEMMANINDPGVVRQRLAEIRALNQRAVELRKNNLDVLRQNYGHDPLDYSKFDKQPPTTNLGGATGSFDKPSGKQVVRTGTQNGRKVVQYSDGSIEYAD